MQMLYYYFMYEHNVEYHSLNSYFLRKKSETIKEDTSLLRN